MRCNLTTCNDDVVIWAPIPTSIILISNAYALCISIWVSTCIWFTHIFFVFIPLTPLYQQSSIKLEKYFFFVACHDFSILHFFSDIVHFDLQLALASNQKMQRKKVVRITFCLHFWLQSCFIVLIWLSRLQSNQSNNKGK